MPTIMVILNILFIAGVVLGIVGLLTWGIVADRPFATYLTNLATMPAQRMQDRRRVARVPDRRRVPREAAGYRGPGRRAIDVGA